MAFNLVSGFHRQWPREDSIPQYGVSFIKLPRLFRGAPGFLCTTVFLSGHSFTMEGQQDKRHGQQNDGVSNTLSLAIRNRSMALRRRKPCNNRNHLIRMCNSNLICNRSLPPYRYYMQASEPFAQPNEPLLQRLLRV